MSATAVTEHAGCRGCSLCHPDPATLEIARLVNEEGWDQYRASRFVFSADLPQLPDLVPPPAMADHTDWIRWTVGKLTRPLARLVGLA